jgi:hypothetical protein
MMADDGSYALIGGQLIDGTGKLPIPGAAVVLTGRFIVAAGALDEVTITYCPERDSWYVAWQA